MKNPPKSSVRTKILTLRDSLSKKEIAEKSNSIRQKLFSIKEFSGARIIFFYVSSGSEVFTHDMMKEVLKKKRIAVPISEKVNKTLSASELLDFNELTSSSFGILEPKKEFVRPINPKDLDLIIVPCIALDIYGNRIGYGHGYFDNFLRHISAPRIALAYEMQIVNEIPASEKDVKVEYIVTETRIIKCG